MWTPQTFLFQDKEDAMDFYQANVPDLTDEDNRAVRITMSNGEMIKQVGGYYDGDGCCAKRPYGLVITEQQIPTPPSELFQHGYKTRSTYVALQYAAKRREAEERKAEEHKAKTTVT
jgi:hypothetical protein